MATPYVTASLLQSRPASIAWTVTPKLTADLASQTAQLEQECWTATSAVDRFLHQPLRATVNTEEGLCPGYPRFGVNPHNGLGNIITRRWPVTQVLAVQVAPSRSFPPAWALVPAGSALIRTPVIGASGPAPVTVPSGGNAIDVAPGYLRRDCGRGGQRVMVSYVAAYPHCGLTEAAEKGASTITVDDVTGWANPQGFSAGFAYDGTLTEGVQVTAASAMTPITLPGIGGTAQAGPGTLTLSAPLQFAHATGTVVSALTPDSIRAVALQAMVQALEGIDAIAAQSLAGQMSGGSAEVAANAAAVLCDYRAIA